MNPETSPPGVPQPRKNKLAIASLVLGILSLVLCVVGIVFAIPGLICGIMGLSRVKKSGGMEKGHGLALAGTVMSGVALVIFPIVGLRVAIAVPNFFEDRKAAQRRSCMSNLKSIENAKMTWALENKKQKTDAPTDSDLFGADSYIRDKPVCPAGGIYTHNPVDSKPACSVPGHRL